MNVGLKIWDSKGNSLFNMTGNYPKIVGVALVEHNQESGSIHYAVPKGCQKIFFYTHEQVGTEQLAVREINIQETANGLMWKKEPKYYHHTLEDMKIKIFYGYY